MPERKVLCSLAVGPQERLLRLARPGFVRYADRHGYDLDVRNRLLTDERPPPWSKILLVRELLETYDIVFWIDADAVIVDPRLDIATELGSRSFMGLVEHRYDDVAVPNTGVLVLRRDALAQEFLQAVWESADLVDHRWWENAAVMRQLGYRLDPPGPGAPTRFREATTFLPKEWNSIHDDRAPRPRIRHYPGYSTKVRYGFMLRDVVTGRLAGIWR
ncbi:MAG: hypothetical protein M3141_08220 [Actinomycetota bacterium]|nr:hypothetical protein [Actinomycetota bacterium]